MSGVWKKGPVGSSILMGTWTRAGKAFIYGLTKERKLRAHKDTEPEMQIQSCCLEQKRAPWLRLLAWTHRAIHTG